MRRELRAARAFEEGVVDESERFTLQMVISAVGDLRRRLSRAVAEEEFERANGLAAELASETEYLDELLDSMPRPAFVSGGVVDGGAEGGASPAEGLLTDSADLFAAGGAD